MAYPLKTRQLSNPGRLPGAYRNPDPIVEPPSTHSKEQAHTDSCGCGDSREHVGWVLYPRVKASRRRAFKGARPALQDRVITAQDAESVATTGTEPEAPVPEPSTQARSEKRESPEQASSRPVDPV
ncbi:MAG: hypothetical protein JW955_03265 [Sedimentisphaerales bacterium]|nr:hypothetical protein [Sedimentisphaerales bacterium]